MATVAASKVSAKARDEPKPLPRPARQCTSQPRVEAQEPDAAAAPQIAQNEAAVTTMSQTPAIMNTTLDLLENSDADLPVVSEDKIDDVRKLGSSWCTSQISLNVIFVLINFFFFDRLL